MEKPLEQLRIRTLEIEEDLLTTLQHLKAAAYPEAVFLRIQLHAAMGDYQKLWSSTLYPNGAPKKQLRRGRKSA